ncbi:MAG: electron transport complex subunit RsxE [Lachnospiraceae bacterium]
MNKCIERLYNGIIKENPTFVLMLGMCPTLAVTTSAINGIGMGLSTTVVLALSNLLISLLRNVIPDRVRVPSFIVIVASFVTMVQFLVQGFVPSLYASLGIYIPLIVVNCIILGRAESFASKNTPMPSLFDGIGMGLGFTLSITVIGAFRELIGAGQIFGKQILPLADAASNTAGYVPVTIFVLAPGAFIVLGCLNAALNAINNKKKAAGVAVVEHTGCGEQSCASCASAGVCLSASIKAESKATPSTETAAKQETSDSEDQAKTADNAPASQDETKE